MVSSPNSIGRPATKRAETGGKAEIRIHRHEAPRNSREGTRGPREE